MRRFFVYFLIFFLSYCSKFESHIATIELIQANQILNIEELQNFNSKTFTFSNSIFLNLGFSHFPIWLKFANGFENRYLFIPKLQAKELKLFTWQNLEEVWTTQKVNVNKDFIYLIQPSSKPLHIKLESERETNFTFYVLESLDHLENLKWEEFFLFIFLGWSFLFGFIGIFVTLIYKRFYYVYLSLFSILLTFFLFIHQGGFSRLLSFDSLGLHKLKFLFLLFSGYFYTLFIYQFLQEGKKNFTNIALLSGILLLSFYLVSLILEYYLLYKIWMLGIVLIISLNLFPITRFFKKDKLISSLIIITTLLFYLAVGVLFFIDGSIFYVNKLIFYVPNILSYTLTIFVLAFVSLQARKNVLSRIQAENQLNELEKIKLENEKKILQLEKLALEERAKLNLVKNEFIKQTVLNLQTPLFNISSISEVLLEDIEVIQNNFLYKDIKSILENSRFLMNILRDLSDYSLLETNSLVLNKESVDIKTLVELSTTALEDFSKTKKVNIVNTIQDDLPLVSGDEARLSQAIYNLFFQILESSANTIVYVYASIVPGYIKLKVKYSGTYIEFPNTNSRIYLEFQTKERPESFQKFINLIVTAKLIQLHGGRIYSRKNSESSITLFLPISSNQTKQKENKSTKKKNWSEYNIHPNSFTNTFQFIGEEQEKILVIDDEVVNLDTLKSILLAYNYIPILTSSPSEALEEIHKEKPDLILVDLFMSGMDGLKFCQLVRELYDKNELPIILITSSSKWEEIAQLFDFINDTIVKPFTKERLISRVKASINLAKMNRAYKRFVPPEFISLLNKKDISELKLGDYVKKRMTILFSDLRNYTSLSEHMNPEENFSFLNSYLGRIGPIIRNNHGFIDKYMGDAIMSIFPRNAEDSVQSAIQIQRAIQEFNLERLQRGESPIAAGIGIHTGDVILGTLGEEKRMEGTVIADAVNIASRLENLTKLYKASILITMETLLELDDQEIYNFRILDRVKVKGKEQFITVVEIMDGYEEEKLTKLLECKVYFEEGVSHYLRKDFETALERFEKVIKLVPNDQATQIYIQRAKFYKENGVPVNWDGVEILDEKFY